MMKQLVICITVLLGVISSHCYADFGVVHANFFSEVNQRITPNNSVKFEGQNVVFGIKKNFHNNTMTFTKSGTYLITYTAAGSSEMPLTPHAETFPWGLGIFINNSLVLGSAAVEVTTENFSVITRIFGQVMINVCKGDTLELRNTTTMPIILVSDIDTMNPIPETSISLVIVQL